MKRFIALLSMFCVFSLSYAATTETPSKDAEIVGFMIVLNKNEIADASLTKHKKVNKDVENYAALMLKEHTKNLSDTKALAKKIKPTDTEMVMTLKSKGKEELKTLSALKDAAYEKGYIDAMVNGHTEALTSIDGFLKEVQNPKLKTHLENTRTHVQDHLTKAQEIQKTLK
jgi:putative membrane protein